MKEQITIYEIVDKAIIRCFKVNTGQLSSGQIRKFVEQQNIKINDQTLTRKIQRMAKDKHYLISHKIRPNKALYELNEGAFDFIFEGPDLKTKDSTEKPTGSSQEHTSKLKEAIQTWINEFSEPSPDYPKRYSSVIAACESHLLFSDLSNHLPELGSNICEKWDEYKKELIKFDRLKENLFFSLKEEILKCFEGLNLTFVYDDENYLRDYECSLNPLSLYNVVMELESDEGYDNHHRFLSWLQCNAPIFEKDDHVLWGKEITYLKVPKKDRALLEAGVSRFMTFFEGIPVSKFPETAKEIKDNVDSLRQERDQILLELKRILFYANFPGECKYIK